jgi:pilus assembly protein CpaB
MNARRITLALLIALVLSGASTILLGRRMERQKTRVVTLQYVAAARALGLGEPLQKDNLKMVQWPANAPLTGAHKQADELLGRVVLYPIAAGQPVLDHDLAVPGVGIGLTTRIKNGMRAVALHSDEVVGVAGFLFPGSRVDVLVTVRPLDGSMPLTNTVIQDAEVLTSGQNAEPDPEGRPSKANVVTLLLTPEDAERVVLASSIGTIHFVLRNGADHAVVDGPPVRYAELAPPSNAPAPQRPSGKGKTVTAKYVPKHVYVVKTILGTKMYEDSFD